VISQDSFPLPAAALAEVLKPFGESTMLPPESYTSEKVFAWEQRNFFRGWQCVGRSSDMAEPGAQRAERLVGEGSILLVRGTDGVLRGLANVCRHRGHELLPCGSGTTGKAIVCPYHAWAYDLTGALRAARHFPQSASFDRASHGLLPVRVQEWHGYIFADPSGAAPALETYLDSLDERLALHRPERLVVRARHEYVVQANWKTITENYHECYHCPLIHPELCAVTPPDSGENWDRPGAWVGGWMELREGMATMSLTGASSGTTLPGLDPVTARRVDYLGIFPNLLISTHPDYVMTHRLVPLAPDRTWVECAWAFDPDDAGSEADPSYAVDFWHLTNSQDWAACESVQRGLASGMAEAGPLAPDEDAVYQYVTMVARGYRGEPLHVSPPLRSAYAAQTLATT
jgi:Rieske 2Fe-2S family protein